MKMFDSFIPMIIIVIIIARGLGERLKTKCTKLINKHQNEVDKFCNMRKSIHVFLEIELFESLNIKIFRKIFQTKIFNNLLFNSF